MRVIAGEFRSRKLKTLEGLDTRPTPDRLREALFNILAPEIGNKTFLDAYAGSGAVGIEALSRGAARAIFIERSKSASDVIRENVALLGLGKQAEILNGRVLQYLPHRKPDVVFLDPPYELQNEYTESMAVLGAAPPALVIVQHSCRFGLAGEYGALQRTRILKQGDNSLSFYRPQAG